MLHKGGYTHGHVRGEGGRGGRWKGEGVLFHSRLCSSPSHSRGAAEGLQRPLQGRGKAPQEIEAEIDIYISRDCTNRQTRNDVDIVFCRALYTIP